MVWPGSLCTGGPRPGRPAGPPAQAEAQDWLPGLLAQGGDRQVERQQFGCSHSHDPARSAEHRQEAETKLGHRAFPSWLS